VPIPLSVEEIVIWVCCYPSCVEMIVVEFWLSALSLLCEAIVIWLSAISLLCEVIVVLALCLASCVEVIMLERGVVYS